MTFPRLLGKFPKSEVDPEIPKISGGGGEIPRSGRTCKRHTD